VIKSAFSAFAVRGNRRSATTKSCSSVHRSAGSSVWLTKSVAPNTTVALEKPKLNMRSDMDASSSTANFHAWGVGPTSVRQRIHLIASPNGVVRRGMRRHIAMPRK
jgi:hypothetical protein